MAQSILIFDFGTNEEAAQQARHKVEAWKQGFRLGNKILLKFERVENEPKAAGDADEAKPAHGKKAGAHKKSYSKEEKDDGTSAQVKLLVRLDFSDHEKLFAPALARPHPHRRTLQVREGGNSTPQRRVV
jgi:hypothetical protein